MPCLYLLLIQIKLSIISCQNFWVFAASARAVLVRNEKELDDEILKKIKISKYQ